MWDPLPAWGARLGMRWSAARGPAWCRERIASMAPSRGPSGCASEDPSSTLRFSGVRWAQPLGGGLIRACVARCAPRYAVCMVAWSLRVVRTLGRGQTLWCGFPLAALEVTSDVAKLPILASRGAKTHHTPSCTYKMELFGMVSQILLANTEKLGRAESPICPPYEGYTH
jgi:hypothetical protein